MKKQKIHYLLIKFSRRTGDYEQITDWLPMYVFGKDEEEIYDKAMRRIREIADANGPDCDPDEITFGNIEDCDEYDLLKIRLYGEQEYGERMA